MEVLQGLFALLIALLTSPQGSVFCVAQIHITPDNPITKLSSPLTLNCSSSSPCGKVKWKLMQDSVFSTVEDHGHYSTMVVQSITEEHTSFICEEKCNRKNPQKRLKIYHFSGPTITTNPEDPQTGQPFQVKCKVKICPELSAELELKHGERVLSTQTKCADSYSSTLQTCEVSSEENSLVSEVQYSCEATLRKDSARRIESANLMLTLREAASTTHLPIETTPLATESVTFPEETTPLPTESVTFPEETTPLATESVTFPEETTPLPEETTRLPEETTPLAKETAAFPKETTSLPTETTPLAKETIAFPKETTPLPTETTPLAKETIAFPKETTPLPTETTPLAKETVAFPTASTKSTASVVNKRVTIQTDVLNIQSRTAFKSSAAVRTSASSSSSSAKQATLNESSSSTIWVAVTISIIGVVILVSIGFFLFKKRKEAQPQQKE